MKKYWTSIIKNKNMIIFLCIIFIIGLISGFIYFNVVKDSIIIDLRKELVNLSYNYSNLIFHSIILSIIVIFSFLFLGNILGLFIYYFEAMSVGFIISAFFTYYGISGLFYAIIYCIFYKGIYVFCFTIITIKLIKFSKNVIGYFVTKKDEVLKRCAIANFVAAIKLILFILFSDFLLLLIGNKLLAIFNFLI